MPRSPVRNSLVCFLLSAVSVAAVADGPPQFYQLTPASTLQLDICVGPCDCIPQSFTDSLRGSFFLAFEDSGPLFDVYRVTGVNWHSAPEGTPIHLTGSGMYRIGGEVAVMHQMELNVTVDGQIDVHADSGLVAADPSAPFPAIGISVMSAEYGCHQFTANLRVRPDFCPADLNHDGGVTLEDLAILLAHFGTRAGAVHEEGDINGDGAVDLADLAALLAHFGQVCPP